MLEVAAVFGTTFRSERLATLLERSTTDVLRQLDKAEARSFVTRASVSGRYEFSHTLVRDAEVAAQAHFMAAMMFCDSAGYLAEAVLCRHGLASALLQRRESNDLTRAPLLLAEAAASAARLSMLVLLS